MNLLLLVVAIACALGVITSQHHSRKAFIDFEAEQATAAKLETEHTQLKLEQGTWATHKRVEAVASQRLGMRLPDASTTVIVNASGGGR